MVDTAKGRTNVCIQTSTLFWATVISRIALLLSTSTHDLPHSSTLQSSLLNPVWTPEHILEANAIRKLNADSSFSDAYYGGKIHIPPLALATAEIFYVYIGPYWYHLATGLVILIVDIWIAIQLHAISRRLFLRTEEQQEVDIVKEMDTSIRPEMAHIFPTATSDDNVLFQADDLPQTISCLYFSNPITVLAGTLLSFQGLRLLFLVEAISSSCENRPYRKTAVWSAFCVAVATYLDIHCAIFFIPVYLWQRSTSFGGMCLFFTMALQGLSFLLTGDSYLSVVTCTHLHTFRLHNLAPSLSTIWYFGMQLFLRFQSFFTFLMGSIPYLLIAPTTIRLYNYPSVLIAIFWLLGALFRPPGTLYDLNVGLCFMLLNPRSMAYMLQLPSLVALFALPVPVLLYSVGHWMWLEPGSGEANYLYFQCLAYDFLLGFLFLNFCSASLRRDKALRLTQKESAKKELKLRIQ